MRSLYRERYSRDQAAAPWYSRCLMMLLGVDTGGTFTDLILLKDEQLFVRKQASTPETPEDAILMGIAAFAGLGVESSDIRSLAHGTTVGTNAVLEGKGAATAYITNRGFADTLTIGRQARARIYDLKPIPDPPPVAPRLCLETGGRLDAGGGAIEPLTMADLKTLAHELDELDPQAIAVNLLFSFVDDRHERAIAEHMEDRFPGRFFISLSSAVLPEYQEYERGIATWLNACVGPVLQRYIGRLRKRLSHTSIRVMQNDGHTMGADGTANRAVRLLLSGPAGGVIAMDNIGKSIGRRQMLGFDMGGTSTDVSLIDGRISLTNKGRIGRYPVSTPMMDIHTIGAGGGSIAYLDAGGLLRVGPGSAGAEPGPACYGRGGERPTVTDANFILGRLPESLGDRSITLDRNAAARALSSIAKPLGIDVEQAALGIINIVNEHMIQALKVMSVYKGKDLARFLLVGFGAAGGLHVCALADGLRMEQALVPAHAGVLSALGMLLAPQGLTRSHALCATLDEITEAELNGRFLALTRQTRDDLTAQGAAPTLVTHHVDLRYRGQAQYLRLELRPSDELIENFHHMHEELYGYHLDMPVEIVSLHVAVAGKPDLDVNAWRAAAAGEPPISAPADGPAVIAANDCTIYVQDDWRARCDEYNNVILELRDGQDPKPLSDSAAPS